MKLLSIFFFIFLFFYSCTNNPKLQVLPFIGNYDVMYDTVDGVEVADTVYPKIPFFTYLNQDSLKVTSKSMRGKVWIADFFFTSCPTICPKMTNQMKRLALKTKDISTDIQFISFSINPKYDQPHRLKKYMKLYGITASNWVFLTGNEAKTHVLGVDYFQVFANKDIASEGGYAHSPAFVLVDKSGYVRGVYVGTETNQVDLLEKDLRKLLKYEYNVEHAEKN
jgi:protein SCO1/2